MITASYGQHDGELVLALEGLAPRLHQAALDLAFAHEDGQFVRRFAVKRPTDAARIGEQFCVHAETMLLQTARVIATPWETALEAWLQRVAGQGVSWWLGGSAALAVRGLAVQPRDFDIITDDAGARRLGELLRDVQIEPVVPVQGWICRWFGRVFLHARFEWVGGVTVAADQPTASDFGPTAARRLESVAWHGHTIHVPPLALQLAVSERRGLVERAAVIRAALGPSGSIVYG
jgi:hypothetical protein